MTFKSEWHRLLSRLRTSVCCFSVTLLAVSSSCLPRSSLSWCRLPIGVRWEFMRLLHLQASSLVLPHCPLHLNNLISQRLILQLHLIHMSFQAGILLHHLLQSSQRLLIGSMLILNHLMVHLRHLCVWFGSGLRRMKREVHAPFWWILLLLLWATAPFLIVSRVLVLDLYGLSALASFVVLLKFHAV